jgi:hypothetical protein
MPQWRWDRRDKERKRKERKCKLVILNTCVRYIPILGSRILPWNNTTALIRSRYQGTPVPPEVQVQFSGNSCDNNVEQFRTPRPRCRVKQPSVVSDVFNHCEKSNTIIYTHKSRNKIQCPVNVVTVRRSCVSHLLTIATESPWPDVLDCQIFLAKYEKPHRMACHPCRMTSASLQPATSLLCASGLLQKPWRSLFLRDTYESSST